MINSSCIKCGKTLTSFGGIVLGVPEKDLVQKDHVCAECMTLLNQWLAEKIEPVKYHYVVNGKQEVLTEPMFYFSWTNGAGHAEFGGHMTQTEFNARSVVLQMDNRSAMRFKSKTLLPQSFL